MKFTAVKQNLIDGLNVVQRALSSKAIQPILTGIYLEAKGDRLTMIATDTIENAGMRIQATVPVAVIEEGNTVVSGKSFRDFVSRLPDENLLFNNESRNGQDRMVITYGANETVMLGWPGYEFPQPPDMTIVNDYRLSAATLSAMVRQTGFAVRKEDLRPIFTGLYFEVAGTDLTMVGTDSFRLALMQEKVENLSGTDSHAVIPLRALSEVAAIAGESDEAVRIAFTDRQVLFEWNDVTLIQQLIRGEYPPFRQALPQSHTTFFSVERSLWRQSVERATLFSRTKDGTAQVQLLIENGRMAVRAASETGSVNEELELYMEGNDVNILFNAAFLLDALSRIHYNELDVTMSGNIGPCVIRPKNDSRYLYLLLPLRQ